MSKQYQRLSSAGPVLSSGYAQVDFQNTLLFLEPTNAKETVSGAGALDLAYLVSHLSASSGAYAITLADGSTEGERKRVFHVGSGGVFSLTGSGAGKFWDWTTLTFSTSGRCADLEWRNGKWLLVAGNCGAA